MIKIPATPAGIPAIETALYEGMNVNVTLLFGVAAYEDVMRAFIRAMRRRHEDGRPLDRHSVASFFVSRVDTEVDKRLAAFGREDLQGRAGLANARAAYQAFRRVFDGDEFAALRAAGCPVQRPLWASTGVKNPAYPDTLYVYGLVAPDTVNTMPLATLQAAAGEGDVTGATAAEDPTADLEALRAAGIDLRDVTDQLLREGIDAFVVPMNKLIGGIEAKREAIVTGRPTSFEADLPPELEQPVAERLRQRGGGRRGPPDLAQGRHAVGGAGTPELDDRLGWLTIADKLLEDLPAIREFVRGARDDGLTDVVLLGMGGSSLAPEVFRRSSPPAEGALRLHVLDSTDPQAVQAVADAVDVARTLFIVSSKSGGTIEPNALLAYFRDLQPDPRHFVAITDPGTSMAERAASEGFRHTFLSDPEIGGRYSALSPFGIVPAALAGVDVQAVLEGGQVAAENCELPEGNSGLWLGAALGELARGGRDKLTFVVDPPLGSFGLWAEQLVAESTGKQGDGRPADRRRAARRARRLRARPRVRAPARRRRARPAPRGGDARARGGRPPDDHADRRRRDRPRAAVLLLRVRDRGRRLGAADQPVRPAQRAGGEGQHGQGARAGRPGGARGRLARRAARRAGAAGLPRDHGLPAVRRRGRRRRRAAARGADRAPRGRDDVGLRPALPALDRAVPQGRPADGAIPPARAGAATSTFPCPASPTRSAR